jgi:hypothetical protein
LTHAARDGKNRPVSEEHFMHVHLIGLLRVAAFAVFFTAALQASLALAQAEPDMQLISKDTAIVAVVGEEDGEGLWIVTPDGTNYAVWTPEDMTLETVSAFQGTYKNKEVTLTGDIYKDKYGNLNLFVKTLPQ